MKKNTYLADTIEETVWRSKYDHAAKNLIANKPVLARILKEVTTEFADCDLEQIEDCIEGTPQVGEVSVFPKKSKLSKILGYPLESEIQDEGKVTFDIRFSAFKPILSDSLEKELVKVIINVEVQKKYHVGYGFVERGIFYGSRMISEQMDIEFTPDNYNNIKKVYSIWICMESPAYVSNTITKYEMKPEDIYGKFRGKERFDLMTVCIIRLPKKENADERNALIHMLTILLSHYLDAETKKKMLEEKHEMKMTEEMIGGMDSMCNLSELIWEEGMEQGIKQGIEQGMEQGMEKGQVIARCNTIRNLCDKMSAQEIANLLKYEQKFVEFIIKLLQEYPNATDKEIVEIYLKVKM